MGIYKCDRPECVADNGGKEWSTDDLDEYRAHVAASTHTTRGAAPCSMCGKTECEVKFTGKLQPKTAPALCAACQASTIKGIEDTKKADAKKAEITDKV